MSSRSAQVARHSRASSRGDEPAGGATEGGRLIPAERWERAKELFDGALQLPAERRPEFLAEAAGGDETLRGEVESLVASHEEAELFLATHAVDRDALGDHPPVPRAGPYRLLDLVGRGGMGDVYRAVRDDHHFKKIVAVKLVRPDVASALQQDRLRAERQILAGLEHPGIARLLDGGSTEDGRPFLVMEYVDGTRLDVFARERGLDIRARVALFLTVCAAVQHAHQSLIVHRDLKPANILVTAEGVPKLLDFGVAKLLEDTVAGEATATVFPAMTPAYASPEQVRGEPITTATDVYSLGAVLYELIAGVRAHRLSGVSLREAICEQVPERPSAAHRAAHPSAGAGRFRRPAVDADLDAIVLKALRKEPARRYPTVDAFAEDLRRYLQGLPVTAAKGTLVYRTRRFVSRNRLAVGLATAVLALAGAYAVNDAMQARRLARERDRAERVTEFLVELFRVANPSEARGNTVTAREMLDKGTAQIRSSLQDDPEVRAGLLDTLGRAHHGLGLYDRAVELYESSLEERRRAAGSRKEDVARTLSGLGEARYRQGDLAGAEAAHREALALRREVFGKGHHAVADSLTAVAKTLRSRTFDLAAVEALLTEAVAIEREVLAPDDPRLATSLTQLGFLVRDRGDYARAEALQRESLAIRRKAEGTDSPGASVASALNNLGVVLQLKADLAGAEQALRESLAIKGLLYGSEHSTIPVTQCHLGSVLRERGEYAAAQELLRQAVAMQERTAPGNPAMAQCLAELGTALCDGGDCAAGEALHRRAIAVTREQLESRHPVMANRLAELGDDLKRTGRLPEAEASYREALEIGREGLPADGPDLADVLLGLADVLAARGDPEALAIATQGLAIRHRLLPPTHQRVAEAESILGGALSAVGRAAEAEALLRRSHADLGALRGPRHRAVRDAAARAAAFYEKSGREDLASEYRALATAAR